MVAEALGPSCRIVSGGWAPWDLQIGDDADQFPQRIRIQVKNSARLQTWHSGHSESSRSSFNLTFRRRPEYWEKYNPNYYCEPSGFLCDLFALCFHGVTDRQVVDQKDPAQWVVYLVAAYANSGAISSAEHAWCKNNFEQTGRATSIQRRPETLNKGIRNRAPVPAIPVLDLNFQTVLAALSINEAGPLRSKP